MAFRILQPGLERTTTCPYPQGSKLTVARNKRCTDKELNDLLAVVQENQIPFLEKWHEHFGN
jgi:hypothetical protein